MLLLFFFFVVVNLPQCSMCCCTLRFLFCLATLLWPVSSTRHLHSQHQCSRDVSCFSTPFGLNPRDFVPWRTRKSAFFEMHEPTCLALTTMLWSKSLKSHFSPFWCLTWKLTWSSFSWIILCTSYMICQLENCMNRQVSRYCY